MKRRIFACLFSAGVSCLFLAGGQVMAQDGSTCDLTALAAELTEQVELLEGAEYDAVATIAEEISAALDGYLADCGEESAEEDAVTEEETPFADYLVIEVQENVTATGAVNIRDCGDTTCEIVTISEAGQVYPVVGEDGDWYEIDLGEGETGFIASWLTTPGPDAVIDIYGDWRYDSLDCVIGAEVFRSSSDTVEFIISGEAQSKVMLDIYRPNATTPEPVWDTLFGKFSNTDDPFTLQTYSSSYWPNGVYRVTLLRDDEQVTVAFELTRSGQTSIYVECW